MIYFNPRSHEGSDKAILICFSAIFHFNPRSHEGSDDFTVLGYAVDNVDFNPRSHEGSDFAYFCSRYAESISIHAPTRGATNGRQRKHLEKKISIHAPTRGATLIEQSKFLFRKFQSTLPRGERQQFSPKSSLFSQQKLSKIFNLNNKLF